MSKELNGYVAAARYNRTYETRWTEETPTVEEIRERLDDVDRLNESGPTQAFIDATYDLMETLLIAYAAANEHPPALDQSGVSRACGGDS